MRRLPCAHPRVPAVARHVGRRYERGAAAVARAHALAAALGREYREPDVRRLDTTSDEPLQRAQLAGTRQALFGSLAIAEELHPTHAAVGAWLGFGPGLRSGFGPGFGSGVGQGFGFRLRAVFRVAVPVTVGNLALALTLTPQPSAPPMRARLVASTLTVYSGGAMPTNRTKARSAAAPGAASALTMRRRCTGGDGGDGGGSGVGVDVDCGGVGVCCGGACSLAAARRCSRCSLCCACISRCSSVEPKRSVAPAGCKAAQSSAVGTGLKAAPRAATAPDLVSS